MVELLRGRRGMGAYWFSPNGQNSAFFSFGSYRNADHINSVRAAHRAGEKLRLLVEVAEETVTLEDRGQRWMPKQIAGIWPDLLMGEAHLETDPLIIRATTESVRGFGVEPFTLRPKLPKSLTAVHAQFRELGPADRRRKAWVWVVALNVGGS